MIGRVDRAGGALSHHLADSETGSRVVVIGVATSTLIVMLR